MGSPKVLARATGSAAERACSSKSGELRYFPAGRPLAGAPSRFGPAQRTSSLEAKPKRLLYVTTRRVFNCLSAPRTCRIEYFP